MSCPTSQQLAAYLDGAMSGRAHERVRVHVTDCAACQREVAALEGTARLLTAMPAPVMPANLWAGVARRLPAARGHAHWHDWWKALLGAGMAAVVLLGLLLSHVAQPTLPTAPASVSSYVADHALLSARDPLADRAGIGLMLAEQRSHQ